MPIVVKHPLYRPTEPEFIAVAYEVMGCVFAIHNEFGRFFHERIYKRELARRLPNVSLEVPLEVGFDGFRKVCFLDALVQAGSVFEFKTVEALTDRHRAQQMHYQLMAELAFGKLVNLRADQVDHEFINTPLTLAERRQFTVAAREWQDFDEPDVRDWFTAFVQDVGTCLDVSLYEEALVYRLGGERGVEREIEVISDDCSLGTQKFRLVQPGVTFKVTTLPMNLEVFQNHAQRLLAHVKLNAIQWINIGRHELNFTPLRK
jgi:GxxExxY protein